MIKLQKTILLTVLILGCQGAFSQSIMFGFGGSYGTDIKQFAPNARIYYGVNKNICFGPEYSYFPSIEHDGYNVQLSEYGFVLHYIFDIKEVLGVYPLLGLNYSIEKESHNNESSQTNAFGASFGVGFHLTFNEWLPFAEYKFITGELSQSTFSLGLIYNLSIGKKHNSEIRNEQEE